MYPVFGTRGACWFLGVAEWFFGALIFAGFLEQKNWEFLGAWRNFFVHFHRHHYSVYPEWLGRIRRGFPAMTETVAFLLKEPGSDGGLVLLAAAGSNPCGAGIWPPIVHTTSTCHPPSTNQVADGFGSAAALSRPLSALRCLHHTD